MTSPAPLRRLFYGYSGPGRLPIPEEGRLILAARAGDSDAFLSLATAYAPALRGAYTKYRGVLPSEEDRKASILRAFAEALWAVDLVASDEAMRRVGGYLKFQISKAVNADAEAARAGTLAVPETTARGYHAAIREHGSVDAAVAAAADNPQKARSLAAIHAALSLGSVDEVLTVDDEHLEAALHPFPYAGEQQAAPEPSRDPQAHQALEALHDDPEALHAVREAYGFNSPDGTPVPRGEVAARQGYGRTKSARVFERAFSKMHARVVYNSSVAW